MTHSEVFAEYKHTFRVVEKDVKDWFPCGSNCVRVIMKTGKELIFTFHHANDWKLETRQSWLNAILEN